jgi:hypothetical protein
MTKGREKKKWIRIPRQVCRPSDIDGGLQIFFIEVARSSNQLLTTPAAIQSELQHGYPCLSMIRLENALGLIGRHD